MKDSREVVVVSSWKTSSRRVQFVMAFNMEAVGVVTTSLRKSNAAGFVAEPHAFDSTEVGLEMAFNIEFVLRFVDAEERVTVLDVN
jgi:hypothetical protein